MRHALISESTHKIAGGISDQGRIIHRQPMLVHDLEYRGFNVFWIVLLWKRDHSDDMVGEHPFVEPENQNLVKSR